MKQNPIIHGQTSTTSAYEVVRLNVDHDALMNDQHDDNDDEEDDEEEMIVLPPIDGHDAVPLSSSSSAEEGPSSSSEESVRKSMKGIVQMALGSFSFSVMFLMVKWMQDTNTFVLVFYRSIIQSSIAIAALISGNYGFPCIIRGNQQQRSVSSSSILETFLGPIYNDYKTTFYLCIRGSLGASAICAFYYGIQHLPLPDAVTIQFTTPPFAAVFAVCIVQEQWRVLDQIGSIVCLLGVVLIAHPTWLFGKDKESSSDDQEDDRNDPTTTTTTTTSIAILVTIAGAAMAGLAYVSVRKIGHNAPAMVMVLYDGVLCLPIVMVGSFLIEGNVNVWSFGSGRDIHWIDIILVLMMGITAFFGQWFTNLGLQNETAATATLVTTTQIIWTYAFDLLFLSEPLVLSSVAGTVIILGYMLVVAAIKATNDTPTKSSSSFNNHASTDTDDNNIRSTCIPTALPTDDSTTTTTTTFISDVDETIQTSLEMTTNNDPAEKDKTLSLLVV